MKGGCTAQAVGEAESGDEERSLRREGQGGALHGVYSDLLVWERYALKSWAVELQVKTFWEFPFYAFLWARAWQEQQ